MDGRYSAADSRCGFAEVFSDGHVHPVLELSVLWGNGHVQRCSAFCFFFSSFFLLIFYLYLHIMLFSPIFSCFHCVIDFLDLLFLILYPVHYYYCFVCYPFLPPRFSQRSAYLSKCEVEGTISSLLCPTLAYIILG